MGNFADRLIDAVRTKKSRVVVGLDPQIESFPTILAKLASSDKSSIRKTIAAFCRTIVDIVSPYAVAVKPQIAFFEVYGWEGMRAFEEVCAYAKSKNILVIADVKRGDISSTSEAYAKAYFGAEGYSPMADAITVNPYFGTDGIDPFVKTAAAKGCGLFILVKTSNPSSVEIQDLRIHGENESETIYRRIAELTGEWGKSVIGKGGYSSIGAVVGATHPHEARAIREVLPKAFFLVPGYGAQGGKADDMKVFFNGDGLGAVVNASRSVIYAHKQIPYRDRFGESQWEKAVECAVIEMRDSINKSVGGIL